MLGGKHSGCKTLFSVHWNQRGDLHLSSSLPPCEGRRSTGCRDSGKKFHDESSSGYPEVTGWSAWLQACCFSEVRLTFFLREQHPFTHKKKHTMFCQWLFQRGLICCNRHIFCVRDNQMHKETEVFMHQRALVCVGVAALLIVCPLSVHIPGQKIYRMTIKKNLKPM